MKSKTRGEVVEENGLNGMIFLLMFNYYWIHCFVLPADFAQQALGDSGLISVLTLFSILLAQLFVFWDMTRIKHARFKIDYLLLLYVLEIYFLREADFHRLFTSIHVTKHKFYLSPEIPWIQKALAGAVMSVFFVSFGFLLVRYGRKIVRSFFRGEAWAVAFCLWGAILLCSQILDKSAFNKMHDQWHYKAIEEIMEFTASIYALASVLLFRKRPEKDESA